MSSPSLRPTILLVEDSEDDAFFFARALRQAGHRGGLKHLPDGNAAIAHLEKVRAGTEPPPDLVFLDLKMPSCNGFEVLEWIRGHDFGPSLEIAVLSGSEHAGDVARAMALGASAYYVKPILAQQLKGRLGLWHQRNLDSLTAQHPTDEVRSPA